MASVKIIGKVAVKVMPDTSDFKRDLKRKLDKIERTLTPMRVKVIVDLDKAMKERLKSEVRRLKNDAEKKPIHLDTELSNGSVAKVAAGLAILTKRRNVIIDPDLDKSSLIGIGTALAALTGGRVFNDAIEEVWDGVKRFDRLIPVVGALGNAFVGLGISALSSASNLFAVGTGLVQMGYAAIPLPGILGGLAIGIGISIAAFKDFNTVLPGVADKIHDLQDSLSERFWAQAKAPIKQFIDSLWPEFSAGVNHAATQIGSFFGDFATHLTTAFQKNDALKGMFTNLSDSVTVLTGHTDSFATIIARLGTIGASWLPQLAGWIGDMSDRFAKFLTETSDSQFNTWIQTGVDNVQAFGEVIGNAAGILAGLATAAEAAGGTSLQMLAEKLQSVEDIVKGNTFQENLTNVLIAASDAMDTITNTAGPALGSLMDTLSGTFEKVAPIVADTLGGAFKGLFEALDRPAIQEGLVNFFTGVKKGVDKIVPILPELADLIGDAADIAGDLAEQLGAVVSEGFDLLQPAIETALPYVQDFVDAIKPYPDLIAGMVIAFAGFKVGAFVFNLGVATGAIYANTTAWIANAIAAAVSMAETIAIMALYAGAAIANFARITAGIVVNLFWWGVYFAVIIAGWIAAAAAAIANAAVIAVAWLIALGPVGLLIAAIAAVIAIGILVYKNWDEIKAWAAEAWGKIKETINNAVTATKEWVTEKWEQIKASAIEKWTALKEAVQEKVEALKEKVNEKITNLRQSISEKWDAIKSAASEKWEAVKSAISEKVESIKSAISEKIESIKTNVAQGWEDVKTKAGNAWDDVKTKITTKAEDIVTWLKGLPDKLTGALGDLSGLLTGAGEALMNGFWAGITKIWEKIKSSVASMAAWIKDHKGPISYDKVLLIPAGKAIMDGLQKGLESRYKSIADSLEGFTQDIAGTFGAGAEYRVGIAANLDTSSLDTSSIGTLATKVGASVSDTSSTGDSSIRIDNMSIPLEDLQQLKTLEDFMNMLRVRTRQGVFNNA